ncbi:MAG: ABC transporter permease, partial [Solirubrobacteraceae bacterium]
VVGDRVELGGRAFRVVGVYHTGITLEDEGVITTLADAQGLAGRTSQEVTSIAVRLRPQVTTAAAGKRLERALPGVAAIADPGEALRAGVNNVLIGKAVVLIVALALIIGARAVANAMLAAVLERRRELALLAAIGWSGGQLARLVLGESIAVSLIGTAAGLLLGLLASGLLPAALGLQAFISPSVTAWVLGRGALIGVVIGVIGAIYPIWRVIRSGSAASLA